MALGDARSECRKQALGAVWAASGVLESVGAPSESRNLATVTSAAQRSPSEDGEESEARWKRVEAVSNLSIHLSSFLRQPAASFASLGKSGKIAIVYRFSNSSLSLSDQSVRQAITRGR